MVRRDAYGQALTLAQEVLSAADLFAVAANSGAEVLCEGGVTGLRLNFWGQPLQVSWPTGGMQRSDGAPLSMPWRLVILHYLATADGTPLADRWLSFRELPDGRVYDAAFRRRACLGLARVFGARPEALVAAATALGGVRLCFGDASFMFQVLPRARVTIILHAADEEFEAEVNMLFDATMRHYLPIEDVAVLGGLVAGELLTSDRSAHTEAHDHVG